MAKYDARIMYATPTPGLAEVEPSMNWNPSVVAGIGVVANPATLYNDMHSYLAASGQTQPCWLLPDLSLSAAAASALYTVLSGCLLSWQLRYFWYGWLGKASGALQHSENTLSE